MEEDAESVATDETFTINEDGLSTGLKLVHYNKSVPPGSKALEDFLYQFEQTILESIVTYKQAFQSQKDIQFNKLLKCLVENEEAVVVPMDKTNSYKVAMLDDYKRWVMQHLTENAVKIHCSNIVKIHTEAEQYADSLVGILSTSKLDFLREGIASKAIPQPQLLIKDHKDQEPNGDYPTRLVIPATNFTVTFSKVGYMAIQQVLDRNKVQQIYNRAEFRLKREIGRSWTYQRQRDNDVS
eukprot:15365143-Ditylum_brightwellii.AAC.1